MALSGLFIGASAAPEGQDGGVNNLFSPFPRPSRACSPPPPPPLFAQMNVAGLALSLALHLNGAVSSQDGFSWGFYGCRGDRRMLWFSFPLPLQDFKGGGVGEPSSALRSRRVSLVTSTAPKMGPQFQEGGPQHRLREGRYWEWEEPLRHQDMKPSEWSSLGCCTRTWRFGSPAVGRLCPASPSAGRKTRNCLGSHLRSPALEVGIQGAG